MRDTQSESWNHDNVSLLRGTNFRDVCRDPEPFDWYQRYSGVRDLINQVCTLMKFVLAFLQDGWLTFE